LPRVRRRRSSRPRRYSLDYQLFSRCLSPKGFFVKLLGLSEVEMLEVLNNIKNEQLDTSGGGTLIQDYKERRFLSLFQYLSLGTSGCVLLHHFHLSPSQGYKGRTQEVPLYVHIFTNSGHECIFGGSPGLHPPKKAACSPGLYVWLCLFLDLKILYYSFYM